MTFYGIKLRRRPERLCIVRAASNSAGKNNVMGRGAWKAGLSPELLNANTATLF